MILFALLCQKVHLRVNLLNEINVVFFLHSEHSPKYRLMAVDIDRETERTLNQ